MEEYKRPKSSLASRIRRFESLDMNKSSSSLNVSTSSLRSTGDKTRKGDVAVQVSRRTTTTMVRFAPPPTKSSSSSAASVKPTTSSLVSGQQAVAKPATAIGSRPGSSAGPRCRTSAGRLSESGPKTMRRSWGWAEGTDAKEERRNDPSAPKTQQVRSNSAPRRILPSEEKGKPSPRRGSKIMMTTSRMKNPPESPLKPEKRGSRSPPHMANKTGDQKAPNIVPENNMIKVSPPSRITVKMIGAAWDSLPSDVQSLGLEVMRYRDGAEAAAVEALQEASAAEILLRCLSAFAELTSAAAAEQSPQQTVDEFLALHAALISISTVDDKQDHRLAGEWLRAAFGTDLAPFSLYSTATWQSSRTSSPEAAVSHSPPLTRRPAATAEETTTWVDAARRVLVEEMRAWFLGHVERLLDGDVAGTLGQLKRVSDWLDSAAGLESGSSVAAVERVRKKIYGYLLDHVESAVVALNGGGAPGRRK